MNRQDIFDRVVRTLCDIRRIQPTREITSDTRLYDDLDMDSLDVTEMVFDLEDEFNVGAFKFEIPPDVYEQWRTVGDIVDCLDRDYIKCNESEGGQV